MKHSFTADDICKMIDQSAQSGVKELFIFDILKVRFGHTDHLTEDDAPEKVIQDNPIRQAKISEDASVQARSEEINDEFDTLVISDPMAYEELLAQGALEDAQEESGGSEPDDDLVGVGR